MAVMETDGRRRECGQWKNALRLSFHIRKASLGLHLLSAAASSWTARLADSKVGEHHVLLRNEGLHLLCEDVAPFLEPLVPSSSW